MEEAPQNSDAYPRSEPPAGLTEKQCEVLDLLVEHMTSKQIGRELGISPHTVDQRIVFAREKLGARNRRELAMLYRDLVSARDRTAYGSSDIDPAAETDENAGQMQGPSVPGPHEGAKRAPRIVPNSFDGRDGTLLRIGSMVGIALLLVLVILGSFALYEYIARYTGR